MTTTVAHPENDVPTLFGHPTGLFTLFFAEMWERFSYYGMRALLVFYMIKGFLGFNDTKAYAVYGAYTALVYATPFIGGMLADRLLGARRAVILGGLLMAAGHLLMTFEESTAFFGALALLIVGNGFFKPNISTIVGSLYPAGGKRDGGFTIFYMGINLGAAMSPLLCGYIGETYGWHYGFGLATIGMMVGLAVFVMPVRITQLLILAGAFGSALGLLFFWDSAYQFGVNLFVALALVAAGVIAFVALQRGGGLPTWAGAPKDPTQLKAKVLGFLPKEWAVYLGVLVSIPLFALLVQRNEIAGWILSAFGAVAFASLLGWAILKGKVIERHRMYVVLILMFFSMLFWAFFEQAGSSINNFTDRNVDRVFEARVVTAEEVGETLPLTLTQEQLGRTLGERVITLDQLDTARGEDREAAAAAAALAGAEGTAPGETLVVPEVPVEQAGGTRVQWPVSEDDVGMGVGGAEVPASIFQSANPIFILLFGLLFTGMWAFLGRRGWEPSTPVKFSLGLLQLGLGFGALWYGATAAADERGMVAIPWLLLGYLLHTTGELCLSPVGLSMVTRLSPARLVSTVMGAWFLATAFSNYLAGMIATLTGVVSDEADGVNRIPPPSETVNVYGDVFGSIALMAVASAVLLFLISPLLTKWMHEGEDVDEEPESGAKSAEAA